MATYYVDTATGSDVAGNDGSTGEKWKTISYAIGRAAAGDTISVTPGTYQERVILNKANMTLTVNGDGSSPVVLDGKWNPTTAQVGGTGSNPVNNAQTVAAVRAITPNKNDGLLTITADGVTVDGVAEYGIHIRNSGGRMIAASGCDNVSVKFVRGDFSYYMVVRYHQMTNSLLEDCAFTRGNMLTWGPERKDNGNRVTPTAILMMYTTGAVVRRVYLAYVTGEGIDAAVGGHDTTIEYCEVHSTGHIAYYCNGTSDAVFRYNIAWQDPYVDRVSPTASGKSQISDGFAAGDEWLRSIKVNQTSRNPKFYGNLAVGCRNSFELNGNTAKREQNYSVSMTDMYFGYNTVVGYRPSDIADEVGSRRLFFVSDTWEARNGTPHGGIVENNIFLFRDGDLPAENESMALMNGTHNIVFRNNVWYKPPPANVKGINNSDFIGSPKLVDQSFVLPRTNYDKFATSMPPIYSLRDDLAWAELLPSSPAIGRAATGSINGFTPPTAVTTDLLGNTRDSDPDAGAIEFDGTPTDPGDTLTASFNQSATNGAAPLTVNFTDTSASSGTITTWAWTFGNGATSTAEDPSYQYTTAGVYTPRLTVTDSNGLQRSYTGSAITVTTPGDPGDPGDPTATTVAAVARAALGTSTGTQNFTVDLGGRTPVGCLVITSLATSVGTPVAHAGISIGAWAGSFQECRALYSKDNSSDSAAKRAVKSDVVAMSMNDTDVTGYATVSSVGADRVTLNVTDAFPAGYRCTVIAFAGTETVVDVQRLNVGAKNSTPAGSGGDLMLLWSNWTNNTTPAGDIQMSLGGASSSGQGSYGIRELDAQTSSVLNSSAIDGKIASHWVAGNTRAYVEATNVGSGAFLVSGADINSSATLLSLRADGGTYYGNFTTPSGTGSQSYDVGFEPVLVLLWGGLNNITGAIANTDPRNNSFWIAAVDEGGTYYSGVAMDHGAATTNSLSNVENSIKIYDGTQTAKLVGVVTLDADGFDINYTTAYEMGMHVMAIEGGSAVANAIPEFSATPTTVNEGGTVQFTNLTTMNGTTLVSREWDFGDGETSTSASPSHIYAEQGTYTVTLTVTTNVGEVSVSKTGYITVVYVPLLLDMAGPYDPKPVTNTSETQRLREYDADTDDYFMWMEYGLELDGMQVQIDPEDRDVPTGYLWQYIVTDETTGDLTLKAKDAQGNTYTLGVYEAD